MKQLILAPDKQSLKAAVNYKLCLFLDGFTDALILTGMLVLVGLLLQFLHLPGEHVVFVLAMGLLTLLFLFQVGISFVYVFSHPNLAFMGAFSSLSVALACITLIFAFEGWWGKHIMMILTLPLLLLSLVILIGYFIMGQHRHTTHRKFLYRNIVLPYLFIMLLWLTYLIRHEVREKREAQKEMVYETEQTRGAVGLVNTDVMPNEPLFMLKGVQPS